MKGSVGAEGQFFGTFMWQLSILLMRLEHICSSMNNSLFLKHLNLEKAKMLMPIR